MRIHGGRVGRKKQTSYFILVSSITIYRYFFLEPYKHAGRNGRKNQSSSVDIFVILQHQKIKTRYHN